MGTKSLVTVNNNLLCGIDIETTGLNPEKHEIIQIGIIPLDQNLEPAKDLPLLDLKIKPTDATTIDERALAISNVQLSDILMTGIEPEVARNLFEMWFEQLKLGPNKNVVPLGHNILMEISFLIKWLGWESYNYYFHGHTRDTMMLASYFNDRAEFQAEQTPFPKLDLGSIARRIGVEYLSPMAHDAVYDAWIAAQVYKKLLIKFMGI